MSTYLNLSNGALWIQGILRNGEDGAIGAGAMKEVKKGDSFTGSNYYDRFTYAGMISSGIDAVRAAEEAILLKTVDDGIPFSEEFSDTPNNPLVYHESIHAGTSAILDFETDLGSPALFMTIETNHDISVYLNGLSDARLDISANTSFGFQRGELLVSTITISNTSSGASTATVQVIVGTVS